MCRCQIVLEKNTVDSSNNCHIESNDPWSAHSPCHWRKEYFENNAEWGQQRWHAHEFWFCSRLAGSSASSPFSKTTMLPPKVTMGWCIAGWRWQRKRLCWNVFYSKRWIQEYLSNCCSAKWQIGDSFEGHHWQTIIRLIRAFYTALEFQSFLMSLVSSSRKRMAPTDAEASVFATQNWST